MLCTYTVFKHCTELSLPQFIPYNYWRSGGKFSSLCFQVPYDYEWWITQIESFSTGTSLGRNGDLMQGFPLIWVKAQSLCLIGHHENTWQHRVILKFASSRRRLDSFKICPLLSRGTSPSFSLNTRLEVPQDRSVCTLRTRGITFIPTRSWTRDWIFRSSSA